jgi:hypothetical protein
MKSSVRTAVAVVFTTAATVALASEGPEGMGDMQGARPLLYLLGGVAALGVVIWLMLKVMNRNG